MLWSPPLSGDAADYVRLAEGLAAGAGFVGSDGSPTSWRPPLYPALLAPFLGAQAWGQAAGLVAVRGLQAILATGTVLLTYYVAAEAGGRWIGRCAAAFQALNVAHIAAVSRMLSETVFTFLVMGTVACLVLATRPGSPASREPWKFAGAGVLLGLAALTRSVALVLPVFLVPALLLASPRLGLSRGQAFVRGGILCAVFALTLAPWTARNARVHGAFVPVATQGGGTLYAGNHPDGGRILGNMADDARTRRAASMSEIDASSFLAEATVDDWVANPGAALRLLPLKALYFWTPEDWELLPGSGRFNAVYAFTMFWLLALPMSVVTRTRGGAQDRRRPNVRLSAALERGEQADPALRADGDGRFNAWRLWPVWAVCAAWVSVALVFYGSPRFRFPVEPLISVGAAFGLASIIRRFGMQRAAGALAAAAAGTVATLVVWNPVGTAIKSALSAVGVW